MENNSQRGRPTCIVANGRAPGKAGPKERSRRNMIPTQEGVSNDANDDHNEREEVYLSFSNLNIEALIDAASKSRPSSLRSASSIV